MTPRSTGMLACVSLALSAQNYRPRPQVLTFFSDVDDTDQPYALYVTQDYNATLEYRLLISLHPFTPDWKLPGEAAQQMRATGAVEVR